MIPNTGTILSQQFEIKEQSSKNYRMEFEPKRVIGFADGIEAMKQVIFKILNTERYQYEIYSWNYGIELVGLYGEPISYVVPELKRRITEALTWDSRITGVYDFSFEVKKNMVHTTFTVRTIFGNIPAEREVNL